MTGGKETLSRPQPVTELLKLPLALPALILAAAVEYTFTSGKNLGHITTRPHFVPVREISIDILQKSRLFSRSVNIMAKRTLTPAEIGDIVRKTRKAAGLRQDELAGTAGVGLRFIVNLEAGKPTAQIGKTLQVLTALGCSFDITPPPELEEGRKA